MGGIVESITDALDPLDNWLEGAGDTISSGFREIGKFAESVGREIGKVGQAAINDPIGTIAKVAAIATQNYWALPVISAATVVANGGDLQQAALSAGLTWAGIEIASFVGDSLSTFYTTGGESLLTGVDMLPNGSSLYTYSDGSSMLIDAAGKATFNTSLIQTGSAAADAAINKAIGNAVGSSAIQLGQGKDFGTALTTGLYGGIGNLVGFGSNEALKDVGLNTTLASILSKSAGAATRGLLTGQDFGEIFESQLISNIVNTSLSNAGDVVTNSKLADGIRNQFNKLILEGNDELQQYGRSFSDNIGTLSELENQIEALVQDGNDIYNSTNTYHSDVLTPAQAAAEQAREIALVSQEEHKRLVDQFNEIQAKYEEAKNNNDVDLANKYADEANALIPTIDDAVAKRDSDYMAYEAAVNDYDTKTQDYQSQLSKLTELNERYITLSNQLDEQAQTTKESADLFNDTVDSFRNQFDETLNKTAETLEKIEDYSDTAKSAFEEAFAKGYDTDQAYGFSSDINDQSGIGQEAYKEALESGMDFDKAYQFSQDVNTLRTDRQGYYEFASEFGLTQKEAYELADDIEKLSPAAQSAFFDALRESKDLEYATLQANEIADLSRQEQNSYLYAISNGLDYQTAYDASKIMSGLSQEQQLAYLNGISSGLDSDTSMLFAAAAGLTEDQTPLYDAYNNMQELTTLEGQSIYRNALAYGYNPERALLEAKQWEAQMGQEDADKTDWDMVRLLEGRIIDQGTGEDFDMGGGPKYTDVVDPETGYTTRTFEDGTEKTYDTEGYQLTQGPSLQKYIDALFKNAPPTRRMQTVTRPRPTRPTPPPPGGTGTTPTTPPTTPTTPTTGVDPLTSFMQQQQMSQQNLNVPLKPGLTKGSLDYSLTGLPMPEPDTNAMENVQFAKGGLVALNK